MDNFDLKAYLAVNPLLQEEENKEQVVVNDLKDEMSAILKTMGAEFEKASKSKEGEDGKQATNEGFLTVTSIAIALPAVMGLIAKLGKVAGNTINKILGKKPNDANEYQKWMTKLGKIADDLHHLYMAPIEAIVKKFIKDPSKAKKVSSGIFHAIVAVFLIASGATAVKALQSQHLSMATLEGALAAVKGGELKTFITGLMA